MSDMWIDVRIPYEPNGKLCTACNRIMETTQAPWVLILDHDVYLCNPFWYQICLHTVSKIGYKAGWITCVTNNIANGKQLAPGVNRKTDDLIYHINFGAEIWKKNGLSVKRVSGNLSGLFILTHKQAWLDAGGFKSRGGNEMCVDTNYAKDLQEAGYKLYVMTGLYVYHYWKVRKKMLKDLYTLKPFKEEG